MKVTIRTIILMLILTGISLPAGQAEESTDSTKQMTIPQARWTLLKSIVLPGWGEHSLGLSKRGYSFNSSELLIWIAYAAFQIHGQTSNKNMRAYAAEHAGVYPHNKNEYFFTDIGNYMNIFEYNDQKLRNRQYEALYPINEEYYWAWDSNASRKKFDRMRVNGSTALRNWKFAIGALVANRIISVIDVMILTKGSVEETIPDFDAAIVPQATGVAFRLGINF